MGARHAVLGELRDPEVAGGAAGVAAAADDRCEAAQHAVPAADAPRPNPTGVPSDHAQGTALPADLGLFKY